MAKKHLTAGTVNKLPLATAGQAFYTDTELVGFGLRVGTRTKVYVVEKRVDGKPVRVTLGMHGPMTTDEARKKAMAVLAELAAGTNVNARKKAEKQDSAADCVGAEERTLKALCTDYCAWLEKQGKSSHADALNIFTNHVFDAFPQIAGKVAREIAKPDVVLVLRRLTEKGKSATARKLRSYLRAAFACALHADSDTALPSAFLHYKVLANPVESIRAIKGRTDKNPLSTPDLRKYWIQLGDEPGVVGACLRLHVLTGGQRPAQLVRVTDRDVTDVLRLLDPKGKRQEARVHLLPVSKEIRAELDALPARGFKLSTDGGKTKIHPTSLTMWAADVAKRAGIEGFQLKRVRSGIETLLAEAGIPLHTRGLLQSHGLGGVQAASYDAYSYAKEKAQALATLLQVLDGKPARNVKALKRA